MSDQYAQFEIPSLFPHMTNTHCRKQLKIAIAGLGRMGKRHATNFISVGRADVVAAFSPDEGERAWAKENLEPKGVTIYSNYDEMLKHAGLEAVCIATVTGVHAEEAIKGIEKGLHVLCEKPLSTTVDVVSYSASFSSSRGSRITQ